MRLPVSSRQFLLRQEDIPVSFDHHIGTSQLSETFSPLRWTSSPVNCTLWKNADDGAKAFR